MVAITTLVTVMLFAIMSGWASKATENDIAPQISFIERSGDLIVHKAPRGTLWEDLGVTGTGCVVPTGELHPGDRITGCQGDVTIRHIPTDTLLLHIVV